MGQVELGLYKMLSCVVHRGGKDGVLSNFGGGGAARCPIMRISEQIFLNGRRAEKQPVKSWTRIPTS